MYMGNQSLYTPSDLIASVTVSMVITILRKKREHISERVQQDLRFVTIKVYQKYSRKSYVK